MTESKFTFKSWFSFVPRKRPGIVTLTLLLIVAFSLGAVIFDGSGKEIAITAIDDDHKHDTEKSSTIWTCSMHPQIQLPKPGKCPLCFMDLIPLETGGDDAGDSRRLEMSPAAVRLASIQTSPVIRGSAATEIRMTGRITYDETALAKITSWIPGRLEKLYVDFTGQKVTKGDPLFEIYSPQLLSAQAELLQAVKTLDKIIDNGSSLRSTAEVIVDAAREKLSLYGLTEAQIKTLEDKGETSDRITVYAPIGGVVIAMEARTGMYVETGSVLYSIAGLSKVWINFDAYESDLPWLSEGQEIEFNSRALPGRTFRSKIDFIDPVLNEATRTATVRASIDNTDHQLKPDMFVSGTAYASAYNAGNDNLLIPATAPLLTGTRAVVYVRLPDDDHIIFEGREVQLGVRTGQYYTVIDGLDEGELVVTNGAFRIDSELQLQAKPSMMNPTGERQMTGHEHHQINGKNGAFPSHEESSREKPSSLNIDKKALNSLTPLYQTYFEIQMALANDSQKEAADAYRNLNENIDAIDMSFFEGKAHQRWMDYSRLLLKHIKDGAGAKGIEESRDAFFHLSNTMIEMQKEFGHAEDRDYFLTYCPMTRDNSGAYWLQTVDTVYNSFYGASMLRCGEIRGTLKAAMITRE